MDNIVENFDNRQILVSFIEQKINNFIKLLKSNFPCLKIELFKTYIEAGLKEDPINLMLEIKKHKGMKTTNDIIGFLGYKPEKINPEVLKKMDDYINLFDKLTDLFTSK